MNVKNVENYTEEKEGMSISPLSCPHPLLIWPPLHLSSASVIPI